MTERRTWVKLHKGWYESLSHRDLPWSVLSLGPLLIILADEDSWKESGHARICSSSDCDAVVKRIATVTRQHRKTIRNALDLFVECGTLIVPEGGGWAFPNYRKHQEDPRTGRKRERARASGTGSAQVRGEADVEAEAEADAEVDPLSLVSLHPSTPAEKVQAALNPRLIELGGPTVGGVRQPRLLVRIDQLEPLLAAGADADLIFATAERTKAGIEDGDVDPEFWGSLILTRWFDTLASRQPGQRVWLQGSTPLEPNNDGFGDL